MAKVAFNKKKARFTSKPKLKLMKKSMKCCTWSKALYGAETWTLRDVDQIYLERFEFLLNGSITMCLQRNIILNSVRQHNHFISQGNYKATCFDYRFVMLRPILSIVSQDAMHTLGSHRVYIHGIHQIK